MISEICFFGGMNIYNWIQSFCRVLFLGVESSETSKLFLIKNGPTVDGIWNDTGEDLWLSWRILGFARIIPQDQLDVAMSWE